MSPTPDAGGVSAVGWSGWHGWLRTQWLHPTMIAPATIAMAMVAWGSGAVVVVVVCFVDTESVCMTLGDIGD